MKEQNVSSLDTLQDTRILTQKRLPYILEFPHVYKAILARISIL
ncbi:hypothetical protein ACFSJY_14405 [Thalassotalea euphylliae]